MENIKTIIGFDLGHGETSLAYSFLTSDDSPKIIEIENRKSFVTAIGTSAKIGKVIGEKVFRIPDLENLYIAFKKAPSEIGFSQNLFIEYTQTVFSKIPSNLIELHNSFVFIGCPSGWSRADVDSYEAVFKIALDSNVKVVKESRAALLQGKESGLIEGKDLKSSALVIDVGSLTTDISHIYAGTEDEKIDIGLNLGSGLIDEMIFKTTIELMKETEALKSMLQTSNDKNILKSICLYSCREAKESFFNNEEEFRLFQNDVDNRNVKIGIDNETLFTPRVNAKVIDTILNTPLDELKGFTWISAFENILTVSKSTLAHRGFYPEIVLLTGGASRMPFIEKCCFKIFPKCKIIKYSPPEETVSLGLTRWGKIYMQTSEFTNEISNLCKDKMPKVIEQYKDPFSNDLSKNISSKIAKVCIQNALINWRNGYIDTLHEMEDLLKNEIKEWLDSEEAKLSIILSCTEILKPITTYVNSETLLICKKFGIPHSILEINADFNPKDISDSVKNVYSPFEGLLFLTSILSFIAIFITTGILKTLVGAGVATGGGTLALAALIGAWTLFFGTFYVQELLRIKSLPIWLRKELMTDDKLKSTIDKVEDEIKSKLKDDIQNKQFSIISKKISDSFESNLILKANEVKWIID